MSTRFMDCKHCGTTWQYETSGWNMQGGWSGFLQSTVNSHIAMCEYWSPEQRLSFIERNEKRLKKKPNLHTQVFFNRNHTGVAKTVISDASFAAKTLGSIKSEKKAKSSRENGKKGGRPKKEK